MPGFSVQNAVQWEDAFSDYTACADAHSSLTDIFVVFIQLSFEIAVTESHGGDSFERFECLAKVLNIVKQAPNIKELLDDFQ